MREIKFRAWDGKKIWFPETIGKGFATENLMQYTGLKDKNGKDVYEGDLLKVIDAVDNPYIVHVKWDNEKAGFHRVQDYSYGEIIGNIYSNPELLK